MNIKTKSLLIQSVGIVTAITAIYTVLPSLRSWYFHFTGPAFDNIMGTMQVYSLILGVIIDIIGSIKLFVAYGLIKLKPWGRKLGVCILAADAFFRSYGTLRTVICGLRYKKPMVISATTNVIHISMNPTLIIAFLSIISVWILSRRSEGSSLKTGNGFRSQ